MSNFTELVDLASERVGGAVLAANDEFFAPKENLIKASRPVFEEDRYTDRGKWMDGWETRRRRTPGYDWCLIKLGLPGILRGVVVDTSYFKGNYPEQCQLEACAADTRASVEQLTSASAHWVVILPPSDLKGDTQNLFAIENPQRFTHLRFKIFPDGGVARLRAFGVVVPYWNRLAAQEMIDLVAVEKGGLVLASSDVFFGAPQNLIMPGRSESMADGWETRRRRGPGNDWVILKLGTEGTIHRVEVDTSHFKGNYPESCSLEGSLSGDLSIAELSSGNIDWKELLPQMKLEANTRHFFEKDVQAIGPVTHVRFNIYPDGGVARLRLYGRISQGKTIPQGLERLNQLGQEEAETELLSCCGASAWARRLAHLRPFQTVQGLFEASNRIWWDLTGEDWLEAFGRHPRIGEKQAAGESSVQARQWLEAERAGAEWASSELLARLEEASRAYEAKFGFIFIVCATGKSGEEMLALVRKRLENDPAQELRIAAEEQRRITRLRLERLLTERV